MRPPLLHLPHLHRCPDRSRIQDSTPLLSSRFWLPLLYLVSSRGKGQVADIEKSELLGFGGQRARKQVFPQENCRSRVHLAVLVAVVTLASCFLPCQGQLAALPVSADAHNADSRITEAIKQVSADRIKQTIEKLVSFGNRSTISPQDEESIKVGKGVGAAREWIKAEFERYSKDCGGCLEVKTDAFTEQRGDRIKNPTEITNVYAVLRGSDPEIGR